ncbi:MAG: hypothetical protein M0006_12810 [Magnetospirillum sp.]|nr:hypothetical protein [Magnetospirillum sp.]
MVVTIVTAGEFPSYVPDAATAIVRIYDPVEDWRTDGAGLANAGWGAALPLAFWDVGMTGMGMLETALVRMLGRRRELCLSLGQRLFGDDIPWRPFLPADACDIRRFADSLAARGVRNVLVVCNNGRARSWTVARWLADHLGAEPPQARGWLRESEWIARTLTACAKSRRPTRVPPMAPLPV